MEVHHIHCTNKANRTICAYLECSKAIPSLCRLSDKVKTLWRKESSCSSSKNMDREQFDFEFLEKRQIALDSWLRTIPSVFNLGTNGSNLDLAHKQNIIRVVRSFLLNLDSDMYTVGKSSSHNDPGHHRKYFEYDAYSGPTLGNTRIESIDSRNGFSNQTNPDNCTIQSVESCLSPTNTLPIAAVTLSSLNS